MGKDTSNNLRLGLFVLSGTIFLILALYLIGNKRELFSSTFKISAKFNNVNGLMSGNNVRFAGINVGTVESVKIVSDSMVRVVMVIEKKHQQFIRKNAVAAVGTEGLMGNKLININSSSEPAAVVEENDELASQKPIETDEMMRTLNTTNQNIEAITSDLKKITRKISSPNSLWSILMDTVVAENVKQAIVNIKQTSATSAVIVGDLSAIVNNIQAGKGTVGALLTDTTISYKLEQAIVDVKIVSEKMAIVSGDLSKITQKINRGEGAVGTLLMDTMFVKNLNKSMENIKTGSEGFSDNMEALKHSVLFRKYFKKKEKTIPKK